jgi:hypothetical protein
LKFEALKQTLQEVEILGARWLYYGNLASERGDRELAERHYARGQKWHDRMNEIDTKIICFLKMDRTDKEL